MRLSGLEPPRPRDLDLSRCSLRELEQLSERVTAELNRKRDDARRRVRQELAALARREGIGLCEALGVFREPGWRDR